MSRVTHSVVVVLIVASAPIAYASGQAFLRVANGDVATDAKESSGVAWVDYDGNGSQDLFVASRGGQTNDLYRNAGNGTFTREISVAHLFNHPMNSSGMSWGDIDNDGDGDLVVTNLSGTNFLYVNDGQGAFSRVTTGPIANDNEASRSAAWADYDNDGYLDLFVANRFSEPNALYRNNGDGTFQRIRSGPVGTDIGDANSGTWADYDNDDDLDLFVANGSMQPDALYRNDGGGIFTRVTDDPVVSTEATSGGGAWADYDNDGDLDLYVTVTRGSNLFFRNTGDGTFERVSNSIIVGGEVDSHGASWGDLNNDGFIDLVVATRLGPDGHIYVNNGDGSFDELLDGLFGQGGNSQGAALSDYDQDGDLDVVVMNQGNEPNFLLSNDHVAGNWLSIGLTGTRSNRMGIGGRVSVVAKVRGNRITQIREVATLTGLGGQNDLAAFFGLADAEVVDKIRIRWPSGAVSVFIDVAVNQRLQIREPVSAVTDHVPTSANYADADNSGIDDLSVWPNPVTSQGAIRLRLHHGQRVRVSVWDAVGRETAVLHDGPVNAMQNLELALGAERLTNGVYFVRVDGEYGSMTRSIVVMK